MNSMFGKTILKPLETETIVKHETDYHKYIAWKQNILEHYMKACDQL